ncbi:MAG: UDP-N-acetylmuramoyl-tripeptide--D-alanyl-D-alanine ligase, partial [Acidimicrobiales bacterium]
MRFRTSEVAEATGGYLVGPDVEVAGAVIDSRQVHGGELFVPVVACRDGHDFVTAALAAGAGAYLSARASVGGTAVLVEDTLAALAALGSEVRSRLSDRLQGRVVAVTGSVGKTSVKDLLAAAIGARWSTAASAGSFNNELGVPLTLLDAPEGTEALVMEMGARARGDLERLCAVARPTVGVITAVDLVHTETFGTIADVARAKAELVAALPADGTAVLNADDPRVAAMAGATKATVVSYGVGGADVSATEVELDGELRPSFRLHSPWGDAWVRLQVRGRHQVGNALAAAAAALVCGVDPDHVATGLGQASLSPWRMALVRAASGALV